MYLDFSERERDRETEREREREREIDSDPVYSRLDTRIRNR